MKERHLAARHEIATTRLVLPDCTTDITKWHYKTKVSVPAQQNASTVTPQIIGNVLPDRKPDH